MLSMSCRSLKTVIGLTSLAILGLTTLAPAAHAEVILDTFGPGASFSPLGTFVNNYVDNDPGPSNGMVYYQALSTAFTTNADYTLDNVVLALSQNSRTGSGVTVRIVGSNGSLPDDTAVLATTTIGSISSAMEYTGSFQALAPTLLAGKTYWLQVLPGSNDTGITWHEGTGNALTSTDSGGGWNTPYSGTPSAFRLNGVSATAAAAPEPGSIALLLTAGVPVVGIVRRRKRS